MKINLISALVAAAIGSMASSAMALAPSQFQSSPGDTLELYISGATAQENGLTAAMRTLCTAGSLDTYLATNQFAHFCTIDKTKFTGTAFSLPASVTKMVVYKSGVGGSGNGVQPVANASTTLSFISMANLKASPSLVGVTTSVASVVGLIAYNRVDVAASGVLVSSLTEAGFSDVEPKLLGATAGQIANLTVVAPNNLIFGVPVTRSARNALQTAQSLGVGSETEANMPSLRFPQLTSVYNGAIQAWSLLGVTLADDLIFIASRVETSGTQKTFNALITQAACSADVPAIPLADIDPGTSLTYSQADCALAVPNARVVAGSGSVNVTACLKGHDDNGRGAFGVLSTEFVPVQLAGGGATDSGYRYIKIDGYSPTDVNVVNGDYKFWVEPSFQYRKTTTPLTGDKKRLADKIVAQLGTEAVISSLNNSFVQSWGRSGLLAKPSQANLPDAVATRRNAAQVLANPTNAFTRSPLNSPVNCTPATLFN